LPNILISGLLNISKLTLLREPRRRERGRGYDNSQFTMIGLDSGATETAEAFGAATGFNSR